MSYCHKLFFLLFDPFECHGDVSYESCLSVWLTDYLALQTLVLDIASKLFNFFFCVCQADKHH